MTVDSVILASTQKAATEKWSSRPAWGYLVSSGEKGRGNAPCTFSRGLREGLLYLGPGIF